ncbi:MAG TPA: riboflavin synthase [Rubricoccaceae bacterium]|jgi:riboflavin synthase
MFTGIVEEVARVAAVEPLAGGRRLRLACTFAAELAVDESVAVAGVCLTVVAHDAEAFEAIAVEETLSKTTLGRFTTGDGVNVERAVRLGGRLDGHLVQGHVDTTGEIVSVERLADSHLVTVAYPPEHADLLIPRGSICVDGISLTVARLDDRPQDRTPTFTLALIPHTWDKTTAGNWAAGQRVNLEFDLVGKYVLRAAHRSAETAGQSV